MRAPLPRDPSTGRFVDVPTSAPEVTLQAPVIVELANGRHASLTPGMWDATVAEAYQSGQCLALAVAVAEHVGDGASIGYIYREDDELAHAVTLVHEDGREWALDSEGRTDLATLAYLYGTSVHDVERVDPGTARADAGTFELLPAQDFALASSYAAHVAAMRA